MITLYLYRDKNRQFRWRVRASNGEVMANGAGDGYQRRRDLEKALCRVLGWEQTTGGSASLGEVMTWNRKDMRLEDETILSHTMAAPKHESRRDRLRVRTPEQKRQRKLDAARKRKEAEAVRISKLAGRRRRPTPKRLAATFGAKRKR